MKRLWLISAIVIPLVLFGFFLSCDNAGDLYGHYIYAQLDNIAYEWKLGFTNVDDDAFGMTESDVTALLATPDVGISDEEANNFVFIVFEGITTGTYSISDLINESQYRINGVSWYFTDITLVVTTFEDVGGVITGTFSGTVEDVGTTNTMTVKDGQFNVLRVPISDFW